jgi:phosphate transport system substrate-binding protein
MAVIKKGVDFFRWGKYTVPVSPSRQGTRSERAVGLAGFLTVFRWLSDLSLFRIFSRESPMKWSLVRAVLFCWLGCAAGCATSPQVIRIGGEDAALSGFVLPAKETFEEENGIGLSITRCRPGEELVDLERKAVEVIVSAKPLEDLIRDAGREKVAIDPASLQQIEIGKNDTVVFLNKQSRIKRLTKKQLKGIFTGKITRWKKVGGANREIVVFWNTASAENDAFVKDILDGAPVVPTAVPVSSYEEVRRRVMATPGAIGVAPRGFVAPGVKVPKTPAVASSVILVTKGAPSPGVRKLLELLKEVQYIP